jgi:hypothetical protein
MWQNQPELHRLKYTSPLLRAPTCFKRYNSLACRVTSHKPPNAGSTKVPRTKTSPEIQTPSHFYITGRYNTWVFLKVTSVTNWWKLLQIHLKFQVLQRSLKHGHCTRRQFRYHASPGMISFAGIYVGRGRVPLHGPTIGQQVRPWRRQSRVGRGIT